MIELTFYAIHPRSRVTLAFVVVVLVIVVVVVVVVEGNSSSTKALRHRDI